MHRQPWILAQLPCSPRQVGKPALGRRRPPPDPRREPTGNLDTTTGDGFTQLLLSLRERLGTTLLRTSPAQSLRGVLSSPIGRVLDPGQGSTLPAGGHTGEAEVLALFERSSGSRPRPQLTPSCEDRVRRSWRSRSRPSTASAPSRHPECVPLRLITRSASKAIARL